MVVALERLVDREVLLDDVRAARHRGDRHVIATLVARVADRALAELGESIHVLVVAVRERRRVRRLHLQQDELTARLTHDVDARDDLVLRRHARRDEHRQVLGRAGAQEVVVRHVGARDLERGHPVVGEDPERRFVPRRAERVDVDALAVVEDLDHLLVREGVLGEQVHRVLRAEILAGAGGEVALTVQARQIAQLELDGVRTGLLGEVDELLRELHVPLVVVADLGDDEAAVALTDRVAPNADLAAERVARNRTHVPALVDERDDAHAVTERLGDRRRLGAVRQLDRGRVRRRHDGRAQVGARVRRHPAAEVAVGQGALQDAVRVDAEDDARLVVTDLVERREDRVIAEHDVGSDLPGDGGHESPELVRRMRRGVAAVVLRSAHPRADRDRPWQPTRCASS